MNVQPTSRSLRSYRTLEDFNTVSAQFLRVLRGQQSQAAMSRRLGFSSNVLHQWESGRRAPSLVDAMKAASFVKRSVHGQRMAQKLQSKEGLSEMIMEMTIGQSLNDLAEPLDISRSALSRWRSGASTPTFPKFLHLLDLSTGRVLEFLNMFVDPLELECVAEDWECVSRFRALSTLMPVCVPVICALDLDEYKALPAHDHAWLAARLGVSEEEMKFALKRIIEIDAIEYTGTHYKPNQASYDLFVAAGDIWTKLGLKPTTTGFYAGTVSSQMVSRAQLEAQNFLLSVQDMAEKDPGGKDQIVVVSIQIARVDQTVTEET